ncbi:MAG: FMN-binding protein [Clostridium sp.]|nr:FMN-binding protein [Clostridium sp.]
MKNARYGLILLLLLIVTPLLFGCGANRAAEKPGDTQAAVDFGSVPDGTHRGMFTYGAFNFIVDVVAENGRVVTINVVQNRDNQQSADAVAVLDKIIEAQSLDVDAVTGATATSRALTKAVENALRRALNQ